MLGFFLGSFFYLVGWGGGGRGFGRGVSVGGSGRRGGKKRRGESGVRKKELRPLNGWDFMWIWKGDADVQWR